jgi:branched-chain amino acid transport system substrate-binding protein
MKLRLFYPALFSIILLFCFAASARAQDVPIGEFASLTGSEATFGINSSNGIELAKEEINNAGGVLGGRRIKIVIEDDQSRPGQPSAAVKKLIANDKVIAVLGEIASSRSLEAGPICQAAKVPMVSPGATNPRVTETGDYVFRVCFIDTFQGTVMAKFTLDTLHANKIAIMTDVRNDYSVGLTKYFKEYYESHGGKVVSERSFSGSGTDRDFRAQLTAIKATQPDAIFVPGYYTEAGLIAKQARSLGIKQPLLGGDGWDSPKLSEIGGSAIDGSYFATHFSTQDKNPLVQDFVRKYQAKFKAMPDGMAALGYDAMRVLAQAINTAGSTDGTQIRDALTKVKDFDGVTGKITINEKRNATKAAVVLKVNGKQNDYVTTIEP